MRLSIIIPVYNEEKTLEKVLSDTLTAFAREDFEIILVNDGSIDKTIKIIGESNDPRVKKVSHERNYGKGRAIITGLYKASGDYIAIQDADLEYGPSTLLGLWKIAQTSGTVVYGKRKGDKGYILNRIGNRLLTFVCNLLFHSNLSDIYTCYKIVPRKLLSELRLRSNGFEIEAEITAKILKTGVEIMEVFIPYTPRTTREGKKINWRDGVLGIWTLLKISLD